MKRHLRLEAVVHSDRHAALETASDAISAAGGWIADHNLFSDVMAVISFAIPANRAAAFAQSLTDAGFAVDRPAMDDWPDSDQEIPAQLTLLFSKGAGNLTHQRPAFH